MYKCSVCKVDFLPQSLKIIENQKYPKCDKCYYGKKAEVSLQSANRKAQTEMMRLERRIEKLEKKNEMLETIIESMVTEKVASLMGDNLLSSVKQVTQKHLEMLQNQILAINNKVIEIRGFQKPDEKVKKND
jgi:CRISPR/Cas system CMR subunit Cmr6 (Cas7 group RAMP superfamily)